MNAPTHDDDDISCLFSFFQLFSLTLPSGYRSTRSYALSVDQPSDVRVAAARGARVAARRAEHRWGMTERSCMLCICFFLC